MRSEFWGILTINRDMFGTLLVYACFHSVLSYKDLLLEFFLFPFTNICTQVAVELWPRVLPKLRVITVFGKFAPKQFVSNYNSSENHLVLCQSTCLVCQHVLNLAQLFVNCSRVDNTRSSLGLVSEIKTLLGQGALGQPDNFQVHYQRNRYECA